MPVFCSTVHFCECSPQHLFVCVSVWTFIHQLTCSASMFYELCTHMPSWTHVILICLDITFIAFSHIRQIMAIFKFFILSRSCSTGSDVLGLFFGAKVFHINYLVASTSVHSNAVHINMTSCCCILSYKVNHFKWDAIRFLEAQWEL